MKSISKINFNYLRKYTIFISIFIFLTNLIGQTLEGSFKQNKTTAISWSTFLGTGTTDGGIYALVSDNSGNIYAGGNFIEIEGVPARRIAKWNGSSWEALGLGVNNTVKSLCIIESDLYVGGSFTSAGGNTSIKYIAKWDGTNWIGLGSGVDNSVEIIRQYGTDLLVGGHFGTAGGNQAVRLAKWDGVNWSSWDALNDNWDLYAGATIYSLGVDGEKIWAGGISLTNVDSEVSNNLKYFDGYTWTTVNTRNIGYGNGTVWAIETNGSDVYVAGELSSIGGLSVGGVAKYDGSSWSSLGSGIGLGSCQPTELLYIGNSLYIGGKLGTAGGTLVTNLAKWDGSSWYSMGGTDNYVRALCVEGSSGNLIVGGIFDAVNTKISSIAASRIAKLIDSDNPFPVELISFSGSYYYSEVILEWKTATEINNYGFSVERKPSSENNDWVEIGFVQGHGNSNSPKEYSFIEKNTPFGDNQYRLKQIDNDGSFEYSKVLSVNSASPKEYRIGQNFPNPFNPSTNIRYELPKQSNVKIIIFNSLGEIVRTLVNEVQAQGQYHLKWDASGHSSGIYFYRIITDDFVDTKKMLLMK